MKKNSRLALSLSKGFTLVELLVVMAILGILVTLVAGGYRSAQFRGRDAQRKSDLKQVASALELYYSDYGRYPDSIPWGSEFKDSKGTVYFKQMPQDPVSSQSYFYRVPDSSGQKFQLFARLENTQDQDIITTPTPYSCGTGNCNFSITSSNTTPLEL